MYERTRVKCINHKVSHFLVYYTRTNISKRNTANKSNVRVIKTSYIRFQVRIAKRTSQYFIVVLMAATLRWLLSVSGRQWDLLLGDTMRTTKHDATHTTHHNTIHDLNINTRNWYDDKRTFSFIIPYIVEVDRSLYCDEM